MFVSLYVLRIFGRIFKACSHERLNRHDSVPEGIPATHSLAWTHSCQSQRLSCGVAATSDSLWTCSKFSNQSLVTGTGLLIWTSSCWNLARFHCFAAFHEEMNILFSNSQYLVAQPSAIHASLPAIESQWFSRSCERAFKLNVVCQAIIVVKAA